MKTNMLPFEILTTRALARIIENLRIHSNEVKMKPLQYFKTDVDSVSKTSLELHILSSE